jgi:hypothetical protein
MLCKVFVVYVCVYVCMCMCVCVCVCVCVMKWRRSRETSSTLIDVWEHIRRLWVGHEAMSHSTRRCEWLWYCESTALWAVKGMLLYESLLRKLWMDNEAVNQLHFELWMGHYSRNHCCGSYEWIMKRWITAFCRLCVAWVAMNQREFLIHSPARASSRTCYEKWRLVFEFKNLSDSI